MTAGGSAAERAAAARRLASRKQQDADRAARVAAAWEAGRDGEQRLAEVLEELGTDGYYHLPDRTVPGTSANIDHLVVGPAGVFAIDAKNWSGSVHVDNDALRQGDHRRMKEVYAAHEYALTLVDTLTSCSEKIDIRPALCFVGEARIGEQRSIQKVKLIDVDDVVAWIRRFERKLTDESVEEVRQRLLSAFPSKSPEHASAVVIEEPSELVVYLVPWKKAQKHRLYVRSSEGSDVGYLDLVTGQCSSPSEEWEAILVQLLPHYLRGDTPGMRNEDLSEDAHGVIRRFLESLRGQRAQARPQERPIIACYRWKRHGHDRLYLSRLLPGKEKVELGSFDLDSGMLRTNAPGVAGTLGYCGQRFKELEQQRLPFG